MLRAEWDPQYETPHVGQVMYLHLPLGLGTWTPASPHLLNFLCLREPGFPPTTHSGLAVLLVPLVNTRACCSCRLLFAHLECGAHQGRSSSAGIPRSQCTAWRPPGSWCVLAGGREEDSYPFMKPLSSPLTFCFCDEAVSVGSASVCVLRFWRRVGFSRDKLSLKCLTTWVCLSVEDIFSNSDRLSFML